MRYLFLLSFFCLLLAIGCKERKPVNIQPYTGPVMEAENIESLYSDSAQLKIKVKAPKELEFENGDQEFPKGIFMEFFDKKTGKQSSSLKGNHARYLKEKELYIVTGNVIVESMEENKKLNTEELHWNPAEKKITSDKFVRIETPCEVLTGEGLISNEDFSNYRILKPVATIFLDCDEAD